jgi:formaldehyde-activating enzyme involved in methanogenesis
MNVSTVSVFICPNCFDWDKIYEKAQEEIKTKLDFAKNEEMKGWVALN